MKLLKFKERISIKCSQEKAFDYTQDYNNRLKWDTFLKQAELIDAKNANKGVKSYCASKNGLGMTTEYLTFNRPRTTAIKMTKGPFMFKEFLGSWTFKILSDYNTEVIFMYAFKLRFPFSLFSNIVLNNLRKNVKQRLIDLKTNLELN